MILNKKTYVAPDFQIVRFDSECDIVTTSGSKCGETYMMWDDEGNFSVGQYPSDMTV